MMADTKVISTDCSLWHYGALCTKRRKWHRKRKEMPWPGHAQVYPSVFFSRCIRLPILESIAIKKIGKTFSQHSHTTTFLFTQKENWWYKRRLCAWYVFLLSFPFRLHFLLHGLFLSFWLAALQLLHYTAIHAITIIKEENVNYARESNTLLRGRATPLVSSTAEKKHTHTHTTQGSMMAINIK